MRVYFLIVGGLYSKISMREARDHGSVFLCWMMIWCVVLLWCVYYPRGEGLEQGGVDKNLEVSFPFLDLFADWFLFEILWVTGGLLGGANRG